MKQNQAVNQQDPLDIIHINVSLSGDTILIDPLNVQIPWDYRGTVRWTIVDSIAEFDPDFGITFPNISPFSPRFISPSVFEMGVDNTNRAFTSIAFVYDVRLTDDGIGLAEDPTVQNDSPPPVRPLRAFRRRR